MSRGRLFVATIGTVLALACIQDATYSPYIFAWVGDGNRQSTDFLAVIDANPRSSSYARLITTVPVNAVATMAHHTEYELSPGGVLFAGGWATGRAFVLDVSQPTAPKLAGSFSTLGGYGYPHSFARLPNRHVLSTFQGANGVYAPPGALVELDERGNLLRSSSAADARVDASAIWPYSLEVDSKRDRIVTTSTPMGFPRWVKLPEGSWSFEKVESTVTRHVQIWRLSDLKLLATVPLPESGKGKHHEYPSEPRLLADGSIYVNTFSCGLYHVTGLDRPQPRIQFVHAFPGGDDLHTFCFVPVAIGKFWIQSAAALPGLIALDISDPEKPVEVSRLTLDSSFHMPHWVAADRRGSRVVVTGDDQSYVLVVDVDPQSGKLTIDPRFRDEETRAVGVSLIRNRWPHGGGGTGKVHGALFGPR